ncbi:MAG: class I tRNA ligase family protein [Coriobacteriaceae bacterium]
MSDLNSRERVEWPARAVVTAGMPYGNKPLHFGHIGGVFVPADAFARFLRDLSAPRTSVSSPVLTASAAPSTRATANCGGRRVLGTIADYVLATTSARRRPSRPSR